MVSSVFNLCKAYTLGNPYLPPSNMLFDGVLSLEQCLGREQRKEYCCVGSGNFANKHNTTKNDVIPFFPITHKYQTFQNGSDCHESSSPSPAAPRASQWKKIINVIFCSHYFRANGYQTLEIRVMIHKEILLWVSCFYLKIVVSPTKKLCINKDSKSC